jgi:hypothetical protein
MPGWAYSHRMARARLCLEMLKVLVISFVFLVPTAARAIVRA